jgi:hypothetical protein
LYFRCFIRMGKRYQAQRAKQQYDVAVFHGHFPAAIRKVKFATSL